MVIKQNKRGRAKFGRASFRDAGTLAGPYNSQQHNKFMSWQQGASLMMILDAGTLAGPYLTRYRRYRISQKLQKSGPAGLFFLPYILYML